MEKLNEEERNVLETLNTGKPLTCRTISRNTGKPVHTARNIMENIIKACKDQQFSIMYYISGIIKENKGITASVINKSQLQSFKDTLETVISEHVYSIHKTAADIDPTLIQVANDEERGELSLGAITLESVSRRNVDLIQSARNASYPADSDPKPNIASSSTSTNGSVSKKKEQSSLFKKTEKTSPKKEKVDPFSAFKTAKQEDKREGNVSTKKEPTKRNGIAGFFSKQPSDSSTKPKPVENGKAKSPEKNKEVKIEQPSPKKSPVKNSAPVAKPSKAKPVKTKPSKKPAKETSKKRKRIVCDDSDESDEDIFESSPKSHKRQLSESEDEDVIPPTPEIEQPKPVINSRKRKKTTDRTFMGDDGYFVTVKEEVFESCSDNDEEKEEIENKPKNIIKEKPKTPQKKEPAKSKKKSPVTAPTKGKQSNLMSFFKKGPK